jgi:hypothetical protein
MVAEHGEFVFTDHVGLEVVNATGRFLRFRGAQQKVQE